MEASKARRLVGWEGGEAWRFVKGLICCIGLGGWEADVLRDDLRLGEMGKGLGGKEEYCLTEKG